MLECATGPSSRACAGAAGASGDTATYDLLIDSTADALHLELLTSVDPLPPVPTGPAVDLVP